MATTPAKAKELGSDYIIVNRPITQATDPVAAYRRCVAEFVRLVCGDIYSLHS